MERIETQLVEQCDELRGFVWKWQAADGSPGKARWGDDVAPNPTDPERHGTKTNLLV